MIHNDYESYYETLLEMSGKPSMEIKRIMQLPIEILKTVINVNPDLMKNIFTTKQNGTVQSYDKIVRNHNTSTYSGKSLRILGPEIWNVLPTNVKVNILNYGQDRLANATSFS